MLVSSVPSVATDVRIPSLLITAGDILMAPGPKSVESVPSSYTGIRSIPIGDFPGLSLR